MQVENSSAIIWDLLVFLRLQKTFYFRMCVAISYKEGK